MQDFEGLLYSFDLGYNLMISQISMNSKNRGFTSPYF